MPEKKEEKKEVKELWGVKLVLIDETQPPQKVFSNNETGKTYDLYAAMATILNKLEKIEKALLS